MGSRHCYFARRAPDVEIRGELLFIIPEGAPCEIAVTPHTLKVFAAKAEDALAKWRIEQSGKVERLDAWRETGVHS